MIYTYKYKATVRAWSPDQGYRALSKLSFSFAAGIHLPKIAGHLVTQCFWPHSFKQTEVRSWRSHLISHVFFLQALLRNSSSHCPRSQRKGIGLGLFGLGPPKYHQTPKANVKFVLLVAHLMSDESQMQSSQIGAQTSVLFVSMFQVSGSLTSSVACGWNCPTISFHKKNHRDDHITLIITHHTACFFLKDLETQRLRDSDRDTVTETETDFLGGFCDLCEGLSEFLSAFVSRLGFCIWSRRTNRRRD